jgi:hypothetical protein
MNKKIAVLSSVLILSMAFAGLSYAHWMKIITVEGFVTTGKFHITPDMINEYLGVYDGCCWWAQEKEVAYWGRVGPNPDNSNEFYFEIENAYPCLWTKFTLELENDGTIPAGLKYVNIWADHDAEDTYVFVEGPGHPWFPGWMHMQLMSTTCQDFNPPVAMDIWINLRADSRYETPEYTDPDDTWPFNPWPNADDNSLCQIDPYCSAYIDVVVHFDECLAQEASYWFTLEMEYWNWNEVMGPPMFYYNGQLL